MSEDQEYKLGSGTVDASGDFWSVNNTVSPNRITISTIDDSKRPPIQYPLGTAIDLYVALGDAITERETSGGFGAVVESTQTWCVSTTGSSDRIYIRTATPTPVENVIQFTLATAKEIHAALGEAIRELDPSYVGTPE